ncbi:3D-(3,5/4)-trihydroxycyclohexane-1,2-dione acylhydrolase (decyclizing) [Candidatus Poriferisodalis sp.]|uniref:3D-(3,5/4)-trihydroxycyclohexane-1,2-dione acylhydrolase (decyclizing) n=1 Tax=Candidatus Poriferisodalis sp. TaxID=3101277 RepID=UPI003B0228E7
MADIELTTAGAVVRFLAAQRIALDDLDPDASDRLSAIGDGESVPLFGGVYAIFGHGNVTCLGPELHRWRHVLPTWRGQNEQGMALAGVGFARAMRRRRIMAATSSIGPGATNMITAAAAAHANRMPLLLLAGDTFGHRLPDPVLQQVEHFGEPSTTVNDAFRSVVRYWDRITTPEQVLASLPNAMATMLDPADCGPAFIALPQDAQAHAGRFPERFFEPVVHRVRRPRPDRRELAAAAAVLTAAKRPLLVCGGGVRWSMAEAELRTVAERHRIPVAETVAGRTAMPSSHPLACGPIGVTGCAAANALAASADVIVAVGTRLGDFATGSWTLFDHAATFVGLNTARFDATKHSSRPLVADAREGLAELSVMLGDYIAPEEWSARAETETAQYHAYIDKIAAPEADSSLAGPPTYAQVVGAVSRSANERTYVVTAAGGLPGETVNGWRSDVEHSFDCEYGYSTMGYEISGAWGAKQALGDRDVVALVGDGSYLMMNSDLYSSVLSGHPITVVVCDNGGFAVINRLQLAQGGVSFNNFLADTMTSAPTGSMDRPPQVPARVDFAAHAASLGCSSESVATIAELEAALQRAKNADRTCVIVLGTHPDAWTQGGAPWQVGVPEVSHRAEIAEAASGMAEAMAAQRRGW